MRWPIALMGLFLGLTAAESNAQLVYRDEMTTSRLAKGADLVIVGEVGKIQLVGQDHHEGLLVPITPSRIIKGPDEPGEIQVFTFAKTSATVPFEEGERPLLFLNVLQKDDLACGSCGKRGLEVIDLPDGNYYLVRGGRWGKILPGDAAADHVAETIRLREKKEFRGLKDHLVAAMDGVHDRIAQDAVIDLLQDEQARASITPGDAAAVVSHLQLRAERFRPIEPLVALVGYTGLPEALPPLMDLARSETPPEVGVLAGALSRLAGSGVLVVGPIREELESASVPNATKARFVAIAAEMEEGALAQSVAALADERDLRKTVLIALGDLKDPKGLPTLLAALEQGEMGDRQAAAVGLAYYGPEGVQALKDYQQAHPDDDLARFIGELRRNPARVRGRVLQG